MNVEYFKIHTTLSKLSKKDVCNLLKLEEDFLCLYLLCSNNAILFIHLEKILFSFDENSFLFLNIQCDFVIHFLGFQLGWFAFIQDCQLLCFQDYWRVEPASMIYRVYRITVLQLIWLREREYVQRNSLKSSIKGASTASGFISQESSKRWKGMRGAFINCFLGKLFYELLLQRM